LSKTHTHIHTHNHRHTHTHIHTSTPGEIGLINQTLSGSRPGEGGSSIRLIELCLSGPACLRLTPTNWSHQFSRRCRSRERSRDELKVLAVWDNSSPMNANESGALPAHTQVIQSNASVGVRAAEGTAGDL